MQRRVWPAGALLALVMLLAGATRPATPPATRPADEPYVIRRAASPPALDAGWDSPEWARADVVDIAWFHPASSNHRPRTRARLLYDDQGLYALFQVEDRYVRSTHTKVHSEVCVDSAVELFLEPVPGRGYFDIETNCGGTFLFCFIEKGKTALVSPEWMGKVRVHHSLPATVEPERKEPVTWTLSYFVPFALLEHYMGAEPGTLRPAGRGDRRWRGNLYKVAEANSHPHFGAWRPIPGNLSFHRPECFGELEFER